MTHQTPSLFDAPAAPAAADRPPSCAACGTRLGPQDRSRTARDTCARCTITGTVPQRLDLEPAAVDEDQDDADPGWTPMDVLRARGTARDAERTHGRDSAEARAAWRRVAYMSDPDDRTQAAAIEARRCTTAARAALLGHEPEPEPEPAGPSWRPPAPAATCAELLPDLEAAGRAAQTARQPSTQGAPMTDHATRAVTNEDDGPDAAAEAVALVHASGGIGARLLDECPRPAAILLTDWHIDETTTSTEAAAYAVDLIGRLYAAGYRIALK